MALIASSSAVAAQHSLELSVADQSGQPVPFAVVWINGGRATIADSVGRLRIAVRGDSVQVLARRIGYREASAVVATNAGSAQLRLTRLMALLDTVRVVATPDSPLAQRGFYDRVQRVRRGAIVGEFFSPEEIAQRDAARVSDLLRSSRYVRVATTAAGGRSNVPVLLGRGGCGMTILVDGQQLKGTVEAGVTGEAPGSIRGGRASSSGGLVSVDDLVNGRAVMAIEIYPSTANAPVELQTLGGRGSCGIVAIWTGGQ